MNTLDQPSVTFRPAAFLSGTPGPWAGHLPFACDLIAALKPQFIVELGVHYGDSYFGFCQTVAESNLTCVCYGIDTWRGEAHGGFGDNSIYDAVTRHNDRYYRSFSYLLRSTFDDALNQFSEQSIGLLHLDGSRTYEAALHDFTNWLPKVKPGGVILLHDIAVRTGDYGVWRLWEEVQKKYPNFAFRNNNGLGVLWKPGGTDEKNAYLRELFSSSKENQERIRRYYSLCAEHLELQHRLNISRTADAGQSQVQVITTRGDGRDEDKLSQITETGKWVNIFLRLADGPGDKPIRISPASRTGIIDISKIVLRKEGGRTVWSWNPQEKFDGLRIEGTAYQLPSHDSLRILSFAGNPQIYLPVLSGVPQDEPLELEIRLKLDLEFGSVQQVAQRVADLERDRLDWEKKREQELAELEKERAEAGALEQRTRATTDSPDRGSELALQQKHEQTTRALVQSARRKQADNRSAVRTNPGNLEKRLAQAEEQLDQQRKNQLAATSEHEKLQAIHRLLTQELSIARGNVEELKAEIERLSTIQAQMQTDLAEARKTNSRMASQLDQERLMRAMMENTRSWQMTKPLRDVVGLFKPPPKG